MSRCASAMYSDQTNVAVMPLRYIGDLASSEQVSVLITCSLTTHGLDPTAGIPLGRPSHIEKQYGVTKYPDVIIDRRDQRDTHFPLLSSPKPPW